MAIPLILLGERASQVFMHTYHAIRHVRASIQGRSYVGGRDIEPTADQPWIALAVDEGGAVIVRARKSRCTIADKLRTGVNAGVGGELANVRSEVAPANPGSSSCEERLTRGLSPIRSVEGALVWYPT